MSAGNLPPVGVNLIKLKISVKLAEVLTIVILTTGVLTMDLLAVAIFTLAVRFVAVRTT